MPKRVTYQEYKELEEALKASDKEVNELEEKLKSEQDKVLELESRDLDDIFNEFDLEDIIFYIENNKRDLKIAKVPTLASVMEFEEFYEEFNKKYNF